MPVIKLNLDDINYLKANYNNLSYNHITNVIGGTLSFKLKYEFNNRESIEDSYDIEIDLNRVSNEGVPVVKETNNRIINIAKSKKIFAADLHLNNINGEMCMILPPKAKERYPNGFDLIKLLEHIEEHLYWVSFFEKYDEKPWKEYGHNELGYLQLYIENEEKYVKDVKKYFGNLSRQMFRKKIRLLRKLHNV